jgi:hypothetical protein
MSRDLSSSRSEVHATVEQLRSDLGLFSFQADVPAAGSVVQIGLSPELGVRPGGIVEWLAVSRGAGEATAALQIMARSSVGRGVWAIVDPARECYLAALSGWGVDPSKILVLRPVTLRETCWAIEQCLRCRGVSATWAWVDQRVPAGVHRRWQMAAEVGEGVGMFFRPVWAQRESVWADLRLLVTPQAGGEGETRQLRIKVLYRRGSSGGSTQAWEIDHAEGIVCLVPEVANPAVEKRAARA